MAGFLSGLPTQADAVKVGAPNVAASAVSGSVGNPGALSTPQDSSAASDPMSQLVQMRQIAQGSPASDAAAGLGSRTANMGPDLSAYGVNNYTPSTGTPVGTVPSGGGASLTAPGGNLAGWITQAEKATGVNPSQWTNYLNLIIQHESGGNPNAINNWDSNAAAGHPSQGLMQTIPGTFAQYVPAGMRGDSITDPVANVAAGIEYILSQYGGIQNVPGVVAVNQGRPYVGY